MARHTTAASIEKMKVRGTMKKYEPVAKQILMKLIDGSLVLEEQPLNDDGLHEIHEYFGEMGNIYVSAQRLKKHNGINPRFNLKIQFDDKVVDISGQFAARAYHLMDLKNRREDRVDEVSDEDVELLLEQLKER